MKLISLNTWGGRVATFDQFIRTTAPDTDIFCFQEVNDNLLSPLEDDPEARPNLFSELTALLPEHRGTFVNQARGMGMATFVKSTIGVSLTDYIVALNTEEMTEKFIPRTLQHTELADSGIHIYNFHGVPKSDKRDTPEREVQTTRVLERLANDGGPKILAGDFNLRPDTQAIQRFEKEMHNLVMEGGFKTTRSDLYDKKTTLPYADYAFVSGLTVNQFKVLDDEVSDHLPLYLEFTV